MWCPHVVLTHPALGVPPPGERPGLPHEGVKEEGLPDGHVQAEVDVLLHQGHPVGQPRRGDAEMRQEKDDKGIRSRFLRRFRSRLTRSLSKERVRSDLRRLKNRLQVSFLGKGRISLFCH